MTIVPAISGHDLEQAWKEKLPDLLQPGDGCEVWADEKNPHSLNIHIDVAGHSLYSFDFHCTYMDDREVKVELADVQQGSRHIDEHHETVQQLIGDYVRRIRECAQQLKPLTHR